MFLQCKDFFLADAHSVGGGVKINNVIYKLIVFCSIPPPVRPAQCKLLVEALITHVATEGIVARGNFSCNLQRNSTLKRFKSVTNVWYVKIILANCDGNMYLPMLHLARVEQRFAQILKIDIHPRRYGRTLQFWLRKVTEITVFQHFWREEINETERNWKYWPN